MDPIVDSENQTQPDPKIVDDFLEGKLDTVPIDLSEDALEKEEQPTESQRQTLKENVLLSPLAPSVGKMNSWTLDKNLQGIEITEADKSLFFKAAVSEGDNPVILDITIPGPDVTISVRSLNNYEELLIIEALRKDGDKESKSYRVKDLVVYTTFHQYYMAYLRIVSINNSTRSYKIYNPKDYSNFDADVEDLRLKGIDWAVGLPQMRWELMLRALWICEGKMKILKENLLNRDFWKPADTA
jgi:hypothetical protein